MATYDGFDVNSMINFMSAHGAKVLLESLQPGKYRLYVLSDEHGEYENYGGLFYVVMTAFKPYLKAAKIERDELRRKIDAIRNM